MKRLLEQPRSEDTAARHTSVPPKSWNASKSNRTNLREPACCNPTSPNALERLVQITQCNDCCFLEVQKLRARLMVARAYLEGPDCNTVLGIVSLNRTKLKYSRVLALLRANRIEAQQILGLPAWLVGTQSR